MTLIAENCQAVEDFRAGKITEAEMWRIIRRNIKVEVDKDEPHKGQVGDQVYNYNCLDHGNQPNGYVVEVVEPGQSGLLRVNYYDEPERSLLHRTTDMQWVPEHKRWYINRRKSMYFRRKLLLYRARKAGINV